VSAARPGAARRSVRALVPRLASATARALAALALAAAAAPSARPARAQEVRYTRPLEVPAGGGWIRVPLGPEVLRRSASGAGLRLFGPEGEDVPFRRVADDTPGALRRAEIGRPRAAANGWWLPLELPAATGAHERLLLALDEGTAAPAGAVRLAASDDGESWRLLGAGELRPAEGGDPRLALVYPATRSRHLRLGWPRPRRAGAARNAPPELLAAAVEEVPPRSYRLALPRLDCRPLEPSPAAARVVCRLPLGGAGRFLRRLCFAAAAEAPSGYRLFVAEQGRWEAVAEGVAAAGTPRCLPLDLALAEAEDALRLELYGGGDEPPAVRDATAELRGESLLFRARRAGRHTLAYGPAVARSARSERPAVPSGVTATAVEPGPEEAEEVAAAAPGLPATGGPAPAVTFGETWAVVADDPEPDALHRLVLAPEVYAAATEDLGDLRLIVPGFGAEVQLPYLRWRPEEPVLAAERRGAVPEPGDGGTSGLELEVPEAGLPLSALVVTAPAPEAGGGRTPPTRRVRAVFSDGGSGAGDRTRVAGPWLEWPCPAAPPLPCRLTVALAEAEGRGARRLAVEIDDRGAEPLPAVDLELWRRRDVLLFAWPAGDAPPLLGAGAAGLEAPDYELAARRDELLARPWREARLAAEEDAQATGGRLGAWAIALALVGAAAALVVLLDRILESQAAGRGGGRG
jgi:hypothetical protein